MIIRNIFPGLRIRLPVVFLLLVGFLSSCNSRQGGTSISYIKLAGYAQGTTYHINYAANEQVNFKPEIDSIFELIDASFSTYDSTSIISRINRNDPSVQLNAYFTEILQKAEEVSEDTRGAFDITVGPLVNAWGFGSAKPDTVVQDTIAYLGKFVGYRNISVDNNRLVKKFPQTGIDLNAIAQGFTVDQIGIFLEKQEVANYMVEVGGELRTRGRNEKGELWSIGIDNPFKPNDSLVNDLQVIVRLKDKSVSTSGSYRKFYIKDGVKYSHTIDPKTCRPVNHNLLSATVFADDCTTADAYATACMVMGFNKSKTFLGSHAGLQAYLVCAVKGEYLVYFTPGLEKIFLTE
jgi:FAD:protein FMN transferase